LSVPDGMPLVWIGKLSGNQVERIYGPDLVLSLCERGQDYGFRHYFYGGDPGFQDRMMENLLKRFPRMQIAGNYSPPFRNLTPEEEKETVEKINQTSPDIVWVGLGTPKQDYWMDRMRPLLNAPLLIAVGAAFDLHSGRIRQAPIWMRRAGLEWSFRLLMEPRRLWRRYLIGNPRFIFLTFRQWIRSLLQKKH
jgi:N-acetylglucosaminyldiphosphoundecaprenol N-acetyl-beta-D-mannosaminyltransferase